MHQAILDFARRHTFTGTVLEVGSLNVNGSLRSVIPVTLGVDMRPGPDVDEVVNACDLVKRFGPESWDNVVSAEMLEHAEDWRGALNSMWDVLKPGGKLLLTMASIHKGRHAYPDDYWRFRNVWDFLRLFHDNHCEGYFEHRVSIGACVAKSGPLRLDIEPYRVP